MITNRTGGRHGTVGGTVGIHTTDEPPTPSGPGVHTDDDPVIQMTPPAYSNIDLIDGGGPKIADAVVRMIFWGSAWREDPQLHGVISNVGAVIASPYTSQLSQYGVRPPTLDPRGPLFLTADPPNPFTDLDVSKVI